MTGIILSFEPSEPAGYDGHGKWLDCLEVAILELRFEDGAPEVIVLGPRFCHDMRIHIGVDSRCAMVDDNHRRLTFMGIAVESDPDVAGWAWIGKDPRRAVFERAQAKREPDKLKSAQKGAAPSHSAMVDLERTDATEALREILRLLTGNPELPASELVRDPRRIVGLLEARLRVLQGAESTLPGLAEICVTLAERGDRWRGAAEADSLVREKMIQAAGEYPGADQLAERVQMGFAETLKGARS